MGSSGQSQSSTTKTEPWSAQQPYLQHGFSEAERIYSQGPAQYYPGQTYTDMSAPTQAGLANQVATASDGNPLVSSAAGNVTNTISGQYLNPSSNPYLSGTFDAAADKLTENYSQNVLPGIAAQFGSQGAAGSTMHELAVGQSAGEYQDSLRGLASDIYGGNYQQERNRQLQAAGMAPTLREAQYGDAQQLQKAGAAYEAQAGKVLEDDINRWNYTQNADQAALQDYMSMITGNYGSTSTSRSSASSGGSPVATALGAAATAASGFKGK